MVFKLLHKEAPFFKSGASRIFIIFIKKSAMKRVLIVTMGIFFMLSARAQNPVSVAEAPYLKNPGLPPFRLLKADSVHFLTKDDVKKKPQGPAHVFQPRMRTL